MYSYLPLEERILKQLAILEQVMDKLTGRWMV